MLAVVTMVSITLDDHVAEWAHVEAARHISSLEQFIAETLTEHMEAADDYVRAMHDALAFESFGTSEVVHPIRDETYRR